MSRRRGTENILTIHSGVGTGSSTLLPAVTDLIYSPRTAIVAAPAGATSVVFSDSDGAFITIAVPAGETKSVTFPDGLNLEKGSAVTVAVSTTAADISLFYVAYDESGGITKVASRAASYAAQNTLAAAGKKAIRAPNRGAVGDMT